MKGYKVFNHDWTCRGFQYRIGETYEMNEKPIICVRGFHLCKKLKDCFYYYPFSNDIKIAEVEMLGDSDSEIDIPLSKFCTNKIKIVREIHFEDLIIATVPETCTYATNYYSKPSDIITFAKNRITIGNDIFIKDSVKIISIDKEELGGELGDLPSDWILCRIPNFRYTYTFEYQKITDIKEKPIMRSKENER